MKKFTILAASMALAVATVAPAFAQVPPVSPTGAQGATAGRVKTMPAKANAYGHTISKKTIVKKAVKKTVIKKPIKKAPRKAIPSVNATSTAR